MPCKPQPLSTNVDFFMFGHVQPLLNREDICRLNGSSDANGYRPGMIPTHKETKIRDPATSRLTGNTLRFVPIQGGINAGVFYCCFVGRVLFSAPRNAF